LRSIAALTWPQLCTLLCQFIISLTDIWAGGRLGSDVQASIGLITQCQMMLMVFCTATVSGAVAVVSQSLGAGRRARARRYVGLITAMTLLLGVGLALLGMLLRHPFLSLLGTPDSIRPTALLFFSATMWAMPGHYGMTIGAALFRSAKSVLRPLYVTIMVCLLNIAGDLGFGLGWWNFPKYGAAAIAWSTTFAATLGAATLFFFLLRDGLLSYQSRLSWRWIKKGAPYLLHVAVPALGTSAVWQTGYLIMFIITASLPEGSVAALAGLTAGLRIEGILFMPAVACNMTAGVLVGHALGQGGRAMAMRTALTILALGCGVMSLAGAAIWPVRGILASMLTPDPDVSIATTTYLTYNILAVPCTVTSIILAGVFNGAGASIYPMRAFIISIWTVRLPLAWLFGHVLWKTADGVFMAMLVSQIVQSAFLFWALLRQDWRSFAMRQTSPHTHPEKVSHAFRSY